VPERWSTLRLPCPGAALEGPVCSRGVVATGKSSDPTTARPPRPSGQRKAVRGYRNPRRQVSTSSLDFDPPLDHPCPSPTLALVGCVMQGRERPTSLPPSLPNRACSTEFPLQRSIGYHTTLTRTRVDFAYTKPAVPPLELTLRQERACVLAPTTRWASRRISLRIQPSLRIANTRICLCHRNPMRSVSVHRLLQRRCHCTNPRR
jgi:hypothetical protein